LSLFLNNLKGSYLLKSVHAFDGRTMKTFRTQNFQVNELTRFGKTTSMKCLPVFGAKTSGLI